ncbi:MAG: diaminopimelate epimerase [Sphingomonadales bacterium]
MIRFVKMHGLGNDFVVFDVRGTELKLSPPEARALADRKTGIGCDQIIYLRSSAEADALMEVQNADGSRAESCGNGLRCLALLLTSGSDGEVRVETDAGVMSCRVKDRIVRADMGVPKFLWSEIPLAEERNTTRLKLGMGSLPEGVAVNVGNPHVIFFPDQRPDGPGLDLSALGPKIETHALFPEKVNVSFASMEGPERMVLQVWERGTGLTQACGTAAAAATVAAIKTGRAGRSISVAMPGGDLKVEWQPDGHVFLEGPAALSFKGKLDPEALQGRSA